MRRLAAVAVGALVLAACGGSDKGGSGGTSGDASSATEAPAGTLPAACSLAPFTVTAQRDGEKPAGSSSYSVVSAVALPVPLVPKSSVPGTDPAALMAAGAATDLLGYVIIFGDEQFGPDSVSLFGGYGPDAAGHTRGDIAIFPNSTTPLATGDVITPGPVDGLGLVTTLYRVAMDFKATPDEVTGYSGDLHGSVTIVAVSADAICLDVDLSWAYSDMSSSGSQGTLTFKGTFAATLTDRTTPFT